MTDVRKPVSSYKNSRQGKQVKRRRHKRNMTLYYFLVLVIAVVILVVLSLTVFFKIQNFEFSGESIYSGSEILSALNIKEGDNLFRINIKEAEQTVLKQFVNIQEIKIRRHLPSTLCIEITPCSPFAVIETDSQYYEISRQGKIMNCLGQDKGSLLLIKGYGPVSTESGTTAHSTDEYKDDILETLFNSFEEYDFKDITSIDITDRLQIKLIYKDKVPIELGTSLDLEYKVSFVKAVVDKYVDDKFSGRIVMVGNKFAQILKNNSTNDNSNDDIIIIK